MDDCVHDEKANVVRDVAFSAAVPAAAVPAAAVLSPDVENWVQAAIERIAENPSLTAALTDEAACVVIDWAQGEIRRLATEVQPQNEESVSEALSPKLRHLRRYIRRTVKLSTASDDPLVMLQSLLVSPLVYPTEACS